MEPYVKRARLHTGVMLDRFPESERPFLDALISVSNEGFCSMYECAENVWHGEPVEGISWRVIGQEMAKRLPGLIFLSSHGGISWVCGGGGSRACFVPTGTWVDMEPGRQVIRDLLGGVYAIRMATPGKAASLLLMYAADPQADSHGSELLLSGITYGYHDCKPGIYPHLTQWDVSGYYYTMLDNAKSLRCFPHKRGIVWDSMREIERENWQSVKSTIQDVKILRNSMVGVMAGSREKHVAYARTKTGFREVLIKGRYGPFRNLATLIVRTGWELCRSESLQVSSVYSTIDCVTSETRLPSVWERFGFQVRARYRGEGDVRGRGIYKIGTKETKWYEAATLDTLTGFSEPTPVPSAESVKHYYTLNWLEPKGGLYGLQDAFSCSG